MYIIYPSVLLSCNSKECPILCFQFRLHIYSAFLLNTPLLSGTVLQPQKITTPYEAKLKQMSVKVHL